MSNPTIDDEPVENVLTQTDVNVPIKINDAPSTLNEIAKSISSPQDPLVLEVLEPEVAAASINVVDDTNPGSNLNVMVNSIREIKFPGISSAEGMGEEVFTCKDIQMYFIKPDQNVATRSKPVTLRIVTIPLNQQGLVSDTPQPPAFLEVGGWMYPLIPGQSPVYRSKEGYYIFPDLMADSPGASVGLIFSKTLASVERETFERTLLKLIGIESFPDIPSSAFGNADALILSAQDPIPQINETRLETEKSSENYPLGPKSSHLCTKIAVGIMAVAEGASRGLSFGAQKTVELLNNGAGYVKGQLPPVTHPAHIDPEIKDAVNLMNSYSGKVVGLSSLLVSKLGEVTSCLASYAAYHCQSTATQLVVKYGGQSESTTKDCMDGMFEISEGTLNAVGMFYSGLQEAARLLAISITTNTVDVIEYCYGPEAGEICEIAANTVGNVTAVGLNFNSVNPKRVFTRAARDAGRAVFVKTSDPPELDFENLNF